MIYMAHSAANADSTTDIDRVFFPPVKQTSRQAPRTCNTGCHRGGGTCVCISWKNEGEFETEISMIGPSSVGV